MRDIYEIYYLSEKREEVLWSTCLFVFDSSALLNFYYYSDQTRKDIFTTTFEPLKGRLWIPQYVEYEYLKNRKITSRKPISAYESLLKQHVSKIKQHIIQLKNKTQKPDEHPFLDSTLIDDFAKQFEDVEDKIKKQIVAEKKKINAMAEKDTVFEAFKNYFDVGVEYSFEQLMNIAKEGEHRYKFKIPPGYRDAKSKIGFQIFGDLIIWKQILEHAKIAKKPIIFVTDDVKEDWWILGKKNTIQRPREELIKEIKDFANSDFWMYTSVQFLERARRILKTEIAQEVLEEVRQVREHVDAYGILDSLIYDFASRLVDTDELLTSRIAETNALGFGVDAYEILDVKYNKDDNEIYFRVRVYYSGDPDWDKMFYGDTIMADLSGIMTEDEDGWHISSYEVESCEIQYD